MPTATFGGLPDNASTQDLIDAIMYLQKTMEYHMDGNLDTTNAREFGGWQIGVNALSAKNGHVGLSSTISGIGADSDLRIWAGDTITGTPPFRVYESGRLVATNAIISGNITMTGGSISWGSVGAPTASQVGALASNSPRLTYIDGSGIYTGTLTANLIQTAVSGLRVAMDSTGLSTYDGSNVKRISIQTNDPHTTTGIAFRDAASSLVGELYSDSGNMYLAGASVGVIGNTTLTLNSPFGNVNISSTLGTTTIGGSVNFTGTVSGITAKFA